MIRKIKKKKKVNEKYTTEESVNLEGAPDSRKDTLQKKLLNHTTEDHKEGDLIKVRNEFSKFADDELKKEEVTAL